MTELLFDSVLIANRGEIACRVIRTLTRLGIRSVAICTDADRGAPHVTLATEAHRVPSYLDVDAVVEVATRVGASAVHPGYGFLSENARFAQACAGAGIVFVGPPVEAIRVMGDKMLAKAKVAERGVPIIPGAGVAGMTDDDLVRAADDVGFPLMIKPSAGGGGKGMTVIDSADDLPEALRSARRLATTAFGDDGLLLERVLTTPRHIEVQVLADDHGSVVHLGERECSLQRRHQKVIEESPSPMVDDRLREELGAAACEVARSVDYRGAGTVEFLVSADAPDEFFFLEMNTRLQVEHPVTEMVTGVDLVEWQLRIAAGQALPHSDLEMNGHAIEARLYAEDPAHEFLPSAGQLLRFRMPSGEGIRIDYGVVEGQEIGSDYDPMLAKIIVWGAHRAEALARLDAALADTIVLGIETNITFLRALIAEPEVRSGDLDTGLIARMAPMDAAVPEELRRAAAMVLHASKWQDSSLWSRPSGWRVGEHRPARYRLDHDVEITGSVESCHVDGVGVRAHVEREHPNAGVVTIETENGIRRYDWARTADALWVSGGGRSHGFATPTRERHLRDRLEGLERSATATDTRAVAPMPGTVVSVQAATHDLVEQGDPLLAIEAMKMEHVVRAPIAGVVTITAHVGDRVSQGLVLATVEPIPHEGDS